jgi:hypothetical protein
VEGARMVVTHLGVDRYHEQEFLFMTTYVKNTKDSIQAIYYSGANLEEIKSFLSDVCDAGITKNNELIVPCKCYTGFIIVPHNSYIIKINEKECEVWGKEQFEFVYTEDEPESCGSGEACQATESCNVWFHLKNCDCHKN